MVYRAGHGPVSFLICCNNSDWRLSALDGENFGGPPVPVGETEAVKVEWDHRILSSDDSAGPGTMTIFPELPDRSLILRPPESIILPPDIRVTLYLKIPVRVSVSSLKHGEFTLGSFAVAELSSTWQGDRAAGEPAYTLRSDPVRDPKMMSVKSWIAICTLNIHNQSPGDFDLKGLIVDPDELGIWFNGTELWTDELFFSVKGSNQVVRTYPGKEGRNKLRGVK